MPLAVDRLLTGTTYNWAYEAAPDSGIAGRRMGHPRGRVLGGSSAINGMVYTRGNPGDYDAWEQEHGCTGWGYADVLPYFKRMETAPDGDDRYRGRSGPMRLTAPRYARNPLNTAFLEAGRALGYPISDDPNGAQHEGFGLAEQTIAGGERLSTAAAYLGRDVRRRPNLTILADTLVEKVLLQDRRATGIRARNKGRTEDFTARREVILAAGAVGSPQILMLSGIGPAAELARHGIAVQHDLAGVGQNLQDHLDLALKFRCLTPDSLKRYTTMLGRIPVGIDWFLRRKGVASSNQFEVAAYLRSRAGIPRPDLKFEFFPLGVSSETFAPYPGESFQIHCTAEASHARGHLTLKSADPAAAPALQFNYLSDPRDIELFRRGIGLVRELVRAAPFAPFAGAELEPGEAVQSEAAMDDYIRQRTNTAYHISCTCRMGGADDPMAVVDPDLRVRGIEGLRVADASVMPVVVTSNLNASVIMIGEKAADLAAGKPALPPEPQAQWSNPDWQTRQR
jgi:choline dehydrogenase